MKFLSNQSTSQFANSARAEQEAGFTALASLFWIVTVKQAIAFKADHCYGVPKSAMPFHDSRQRL